MSPKIYIHLVRHAQGYHNLHPSNHTLPDPELTPLGVDQCRQLRESFPYHDVVTHLVASPMRRTLRTCLLAFGDPKYAEAEFRRGDGDGTTGDGTGGASTTTTATATATTTTAQPGNQVEEGNEPKHPPKPPVLALPEIQEISPLPCDIGSPLPALTTSFPPHLVDFHLLSTYGPGAEWTDKSSRSSPFCPTVAKLEARAQKARQFLRRLGQEYLAAANPGQGRDVHIVAVTHGGFLHFLTGDFDGVDVSRGTGWGNCEWRMYEFLRQGGGDGKEEEQEDEEARLVETRESWRRRRGSAAGLTETEQMELRGLVGKRLVEEWGVDEEEEEKEKA
ncbi:hypothetical protein VTJ04DRAFT_10205 [Mycothermus thermophilus]|uniref:uncharacterized protein n=1 Tax=Humicola insolens TaxID=85995 RepID=UPI0037421C48